ncbi:MAG: PilT/PilU family type 4a pilus ATPase [Lentisphaeria bacterium]|nr:PilT/PilU family type 4a pilus ATPase [Lentisphaeria bacterium]
MDSYLQFALENNASDCFISTGKPAAFRVMGDVIAADAEPMDASSINNFRLKTLGVRGNEKYRENETADASYCMEDGQRFRINFFETLAGPAFVARPIHDGSSLDFASLSLPEETLAAIASKNRGMIIIAGSTGSGKSTTLAAIVNYINNTSHKHILMLEDPVEFTFSDNLSVINQREINSFNKGFVPALRAALRENPDCIVIGEMRDHETMSVAISAALTGHLVITTMHTSDAPQTIERIINYFPESVRDQLSQDLSFALEAVIVQRLIPRADQSGMVPVLEVMQGTPGIKKQIAYRDYPALEESIRNGRLDGMNNFNQALYELSESGIITQETAVEASDNPDELRLLWRGMNSGSDSFTKRYAAEADAAEADGNINMKVLLRTAVRNGASDLLLTCDAPPMIRLHGAYCGMDLPKLTSDDVRHLLYSVISKRQKVTLEEKKELDFALSANLPNPDDPEAPEEEHRFRVNAFYQRGSLAMVARVISNYIPTPEELKLPEILKDVIRKKQGLFLITGPTGSGKSTTMASLINMVNQTSPLHIVTIEDPIEYVYKNQACVIEQRELGFDTYSFANGLRAAMREAPDIILVGEMRDTETIAAALTAAETGHLVIGTLHTNSAAQTVERVIDSFAEAQQNQVRQQFASSLLAVVAQRLLRTVDGNGRVAAFEVMIATPPIQALIRENKTYQLQSIIETAYKDGMMTMDKALEDLYNNGQISYDDLRAFKPDVQQTEAF